MDTLLKELNQLSDRGTLRSVLSHTDEALQHLQRARQAIAETPQKAALTLGKLQGPLKESFDAVKTDLNQCHKGLRNYSKAIDGVFGTKELPNIAHDELDNLGGLLDRAVGIHFLRQGQFEVAAAFQKETKMDASNADQLFDFNDVYASGQLHDKFTSMYRILGDLRRRDLSSALAWTSMNSEQLESRGSNLEFELCRLQYIELFHHGDLERSPPETSPTEALIYATIAFRRFANRYSREIQEALGAAIFHSNLENSPYRRLFDKESYWQEVGHAFTKEFCSLLGLSAESPLYLAVTAGAIALPALQKLQTIIKQTKAEWTSQNELPVEIPLPPAFRFHSIFVCPVSKEQATDANPPMMLPCGHVLAKESLLKIGRTGRCKCPYCPSEAYLKDAKKVFL